MTDEPDIVERLREGAVLEIAFPFRRDTWVPIIDQEAAPAPTWVPGWLEDVELSQYHERHVFTCQGWGRERRTVVSVHKPGKYSTRVFYVRQWIDPDGKLFGITKLRIHTLGEFSRWASGARYERVFPRIVVERAEGEDKGGTAMISAAPPPAPGKEHQPFRQLEGGKPNG